MKPEKTRPRITRIRYVAFLRGINVGGSKTLKMEDMKKAFASLGFQNVKTVIASGNVLFESGPANIPGLTIMIANGLKARFGFDVGVIIRTVEDVERLVRSDPFKGITVTPQTRLYVTFLPAKPRGRSNTALKSSSEAFKIVHVSDTEIFSVLTLSPQLGTTDLMNSFARQFGPKITTRNWNTIVKIVAAAA